MTTPQFTHNCAFTALFLSLYVHFPSTIFLHIAKFTKQQMCLSYVVYRVIHPPTHKCQIQLLLRTSTHFTSIGRSTIYSELRKRRWCITHNPNQGPLCTCCLVRAWGTLLRIHRDCIEALLLLLTWESRDMGKKRLRRHPAPVPVVVPYAVQIEKDAIASNLGVMQAATAETKLPVLLYLSWDVGFTSQWIRGIA